MSRPNALVHDGNAAINPWQPAVNLSFLDICKGNRLLGNVDDGARASLSVWTLLLWCMIAIHFALVAMVRTSIIPNIVLAGCIFVFCLVVIRIFFPESRHIERTRETCRLRLWGLTLCTFATLGGFAGCFGGFQLQEYWYYKDIPTYHNVDLAQVDADIGVDGRYYFTSSAAIVPRFGGVKYYFDYTDRVTQDKWICVLPVLPVNSTTDEPPSPSPFDVRFWVRVEDPCCNADPTNHNFKACAMKYSWDRPYRYGVTQRNPLPHQGEALADACGYWPVNQTQAPRTIIAYQPIFISWLTPEEDEARQSWRLSTIAIVVVMTMLGWPLLMTAIIVGARHCNYCGYHADEGNAHIPDRSTEMLATSGVVDSLLS